MASESAAEELKLTEEAERYGVPPTAYFAMTGRERGLQKARWARNLRKEARQLGAVEDDFIRMSDEERDELRARVAREEAEREAAHDAADLDDDDEEEEESVFDDAVFAPPEMDPNPLRRAGMSMGAVVPLEEERPGDEVGWEKPATTLAGLYAKYPVGDGAHRIRVDRMEPPVFEKLRTKGFLGYIDSPISEEAFQARYGGSVYRLTVFGPDPKGRTDPITGLPKEKALTEPITVTVPILPPNTRVLPMALDKDKTMSGSGSGFDPFRAMFGGGAPPTEADAKMHASTLGFMSNILTAKDQEIRDLRKGNGNSMNDTVIKELGETQRAALSATQQAASTREQALSEQNKELRAEMREMRAKLEEKLSEKRGGDESGIAGKAIDALSTKSTTAGELESVRRRASEDMEHQKRRYEDEIARLKNNAEDEGKRIKERHEQELKRARDSAEEQIGRYRAQAEDAERRRKEDLEAAERRQKEREQQLGDELRRIREDEQRRADERVKDTEKQYEARLKDQERAHQRDREVLQSNYDARSDVHQTSAEMRVQTAEERVKSLEEDLADARRKLEEATDPVQIVEKQKQIAASLGMVDDSAPKGGWERFASLAGAGLGKALERMPDMVDGVTKARQAALQAQAAQGTPQRRLPAREAAARRVQAQQPADAVAAAAAEQRRRSVSWASEDGSAYPAPPTPQNADLGMEPGAPAPESPPPAPEPAGAEPVSSQLASVFSPEAVVGFRSEVETAIDGGIDPRDFAMAFVRAYPEPSMRLVTEHQARVVFDTVRAMPNGTGSSILRPDGKAWVERMWSQVLKIHTEIAQQAQAAAQQEPAQAQTS